MKDRGASCAGNGVCCAPGGSCCPPERECCKNDCCPAGQQCNKYMNSHCCLPHGATCDGSVTCCTSSVFLLSCGTVVGNKGPLGGSCPFEENQTVCCSAGLAPCEVNCDCCGTLVCRDHQCVAE
jgi:hypothetical protein